jgi:hypothetical protein
LQHLLAWPQAYAPAPLPIQICNDFALTLQQPFGILTLLVDKLYKAMDSDAIKPQFVLFANF